MNTTYRKNLKDIAIACKNYTDSQIAQAKEDLRWQLGTYDLSVETVNGTTSLLPTPANTIKATMVRIDGASEVSENLLDFDKITIGADLGVTATFSADKSMTIVNNNESTGRVTFSNLNITDTISISFKSNSTDGSFSVVSLSISQNYVNGLNKIENISYDNNVISFYVTAGRSVTISEIMINKGTTAQSYSGLGFTGIHNLELSGLKVEGVNLFTTANKTSGAFIDTDGVEQSASNWNIYEIEALPNITYYLSGISGASANAFAFAYNGTTQLGKLRSYTNGSFTTPYGTTSIKISSRPDGESTLMLNYGSSALTYVPYIAPTTKTIDLTTIVDSNNNKLFPNGKLMGNENVKDVLGVYNQESKWDEYTFTGNENITKTENAQFPLGYYYTIEIPNANMVSYAGGVPNIIIANLETVENQIANLVDGTITQSYTANRVVIASSLSVSDLASFLTGKTIQFERATYLTSNTNLSQLVKFTAYSNGSITLVNTNNQDTTSTFKCLKEVAK